MGKARVGNPDHKRSRNMPAVENEVLAARMEELLTLRVYKKKAVYSPEKSTPLWI
ncbi:hypothetical protein [Nostoc sp. NZL]|uniref:hypothetical protein n=1 Tax=Nostoc sp. NZL TaxID=2650612 RepID=UPI0018C84F70|nr:hypothetical protein [Nostoc sp. NZL]